MDYKKVYEEWLANPYFDEATKEELRAIEGDEKEIKELINNGKATFYIGFDPTADSLHV